MASVTSSSSPLTPPRIHQQNVRAYNNDTSVETLAAKQQQFQHHNDEKDYPFSDMDSKEYIERYNKIEADYRHRLMAKYFSDKDIFGDSVFDGVKIINGETIKTSRVHCAQSYADPVQYLKDKKSRSYPPAETQTSLSNGVDLEAVADPGGSRGLAKDFEIACQSGRVEAEVELDGCRVLEGQFQLMVSRSGDCMRANFGDSRGHAGEKDTDEVCSRSNLLVPDNEGALPELTHTTLSGQTELLEHSDSIGDGERVVHVEMGSANIGKAVGQGGCIRANFGDARGHAGEGDADEVCSRYNSSVPDNEGARPELTHTVLSGQTELLEHSDSIGDGERVVHAEVRSANIGEAVGQGEAFGQAGIQAGMDHNVGGLVAPYGHVESGTLGVAVAPSGHNFEDFFRGNDAPSGAYANNFGPYGSLPLDNISLFYEVPSDDVVVKYEDERVPVAFPPDHPELVTYMPSVRPDAQVGLSSAPFVGDQRALDELERGFAQRLADLNATGKALIRDRSKLRLQLSDRVQSLEREIEMVKSYVDQERAVRARESERYESDRRAFEVSLDKALQDRGAAISAYQEADRLRAEVTAELAKLRSSIIPGKEQA